MSVKAKFHLVNSQFIEFIRVSSNYEPEILPIDLLSTHVFPSDADDNSWLVCDHLRRYLQIKGNPKRIDMTLDFFEDCSTVKVSLTGEFLNYMVTTFGPGFSIKASLCDFTCLTEAGTRIRKYAMDKPITTLAMAPRYANNGNEGLSMPIFECSFHENLGIELEKDEYQFATLLNYAANLSFLVEGILELNPGKSTKKMIPRLDATSEKCFGEDALLLAEDLFAKQTDTDISLVAENGTKFGCHKIFLTGASPVLRRMLNEPAFLEERDNTVTLEDMSELAVKSMLTYLYYGNLDKACADSGICLELLEASEKYEIEKLKNRIKLICLGKPNEWFAMDDTVRLYFFSRNVEDLELKELSVRVLKSHYVALLRGSDIYKQHFEKCPEIVLELWDALASDPVVDDELAIIIEQINV